MYQIQILQNAEFTDFLICVSLNNLVKYCIRKITIFSKRRKAQLTLLITLTLEVWRLILSLVSSRLSWPKKKKTPKEFNSWLLLKSHCLFSKSCSSSIGEREYVDDLKKRSLIKCSIYSSRFSIIRKVLKAGIYIFVNQTINEYYAPRTCVQKYFICFNKSTINQQFQERQQKDCFFYAYINLNPLARLTLLQIR